MDSGTAIAIALLLVLVPCVGWLARSGRGWAAVGAAGIAGSLWITWVGPIWVQPAAAPLAIVGLLALGWMAARVVVRRGRPDRS